MTATLRLAPHAGISASAGVALVGLYTCLISGADAITKLFGAGYAAPQLFALSGGLVAGLSLLANRGKPLRDRVATSCPRAMAVRSAATVAACACFFAAFKLLPFVEVFPFIAMIPLLAALMSGPALGEHVRPQAWTALALGTLGVLCLFPGAGDGGWVIGAGHAAAFGAVVLGAASMVASRYIGRHDGNLLAQVFYPNLALMLVMGLALPFVFRPMGAVDLGLVAVYSGCLFGARWVLVAALRLLPAYVVTPLMNLQFLWMAVIGLVGFGEVPRMPVLLGAMIVTCAGLWLVREETRPRAPLGIAAE